MGICLWQVDKTWYRFLVTSGRLLSRKVWWAVWISRLWAKIEILYRPEWTQGRTTWKWILSIESRNEYYKQLHPKSRWKKWIYLSSFHVPILSRLNCLKKYIFCNFVMSSVRNLSLLKQLTYMHLKGLTYCFGDISLCSPRFFLNFCWVSIFFNILIGNI